ncbi:MAG: hypothetical protein BAJALOKI3v1_70072 [Promethearchaeota archaeon]|nr:MAG: hypothetical protein BAJALOKI3v1_70072 [Candidatus Lokiarchaeota archaeon]
MSKEIVCNIEFSDPTTKQVEQIIGKVDIPQIVSGEDACITVKIKVQEKGSWKEKENVFHKDDIRKITFYEVHSHLDMASLRVSNS